MSLFSQHTTPTKYSKSYASEANAIKAATAIIETVQGVPTAQTTRRAQFIVTKNDNGRFSPVILAPNSDCVGYAHHAFSVIGV